MEMYAVHPFYGPARDIPISGLFWGALIVFALVVALILVGKAIGWLRDRRKFDGGGSTPQRPRGTEYRCNARGLA